MFLGDLLDPEIGLALTCIRESRVRSSLEIGSLELPVDLPSDLVDTFLVATYYVKAYCRILELCGNHKVDEHD